jgi:hypothetical protein
MQTVVANTKKDNLRIDQTVEVRPNQFYVEAHLALKALCPNIPSYHRHDIESGDASPRDVKLNTPCTLHTIANHPSP